MRAGRKRERVSEREERRGAFESPVLQSHKLQESDVLLQTLNLSPANLSFQSFESGHIANEIRAGAEFSRCSLPPAA